MQNNSFKSYLFKFVFILLTAIFCAFSLAAYTKENVNQGSKSERCTNLQKVNNLDELLYQFYSHLDGDCLFTTPLAELKKAWGVKIFTAQNIVLSKLEKSAEYDGKPYLTELNGFYILAPHRDGITYNFSILETEAQFNEHATLFPNGEYPKLLPKPIGLDWSWYTDKNCSEYGYIPHRPKNPGVYKQCHYYFWLNADKTHAIVLETSPLQGVFDITIYKQISNPLINDFINNKLELE